MDGGTAIDQIEVIRRIAIFNKNNRRETRFEIRRNGRFVNFVNREMDAVNALIGLGVLRRIAFEMVRESQETPFI